MQTSPIYIIYVRPPGSFTWTQHFRMGKGKPVGVPFRTTNPKTANSEAVKISMGGKLCTIVRKVELPDTYDSVRSLTYAILADGDTLYRPSI